MKASNYIIPVLIYTGLMVSSCKKYVTVDPPYTQVSTENIFINDDAVIAALNGVYTTFAMTDGFASNAMASISLLLGLASDELNGIAYPADSDPYSFYTNSLASNNASLTDQLWTRPYSIIYMSNSILNGLEKSTSVSDSIRNTAAGEAKFMRAFCYFYLVNMFDKIPLTLSTDWKVTATLPQSQSNVVYEQIIKDLTEAKDLVSENYTRAAERIYINRAMVNAFLSKVYLFHGDWAQAETEATSVIDNSLYDIEPDLNKVFLINSPEVIWQLKPFEEVSGTNTPEAQAFILLFAPNSNPSLSEDFLASFDPQDQRKTNWVGSFTDDAGTWFFPFKYKLTNAEPVTTEYSIVFRLSEVYLIRAEARARLNKIQGADGAAADLDVTRLRAGLNATQAASQQEMLDEIYYERKAELFTEWGNRWFDLKRWGLLFNTLSPVKGGEWQNTDTIFPIPKIQMLNNPATQQNAGYQ